MAPTKFVHNRKIQDYSENPTRDKLSKCLTVGDVILTCRGADAVRLIVAFQNKYPQFPKASRKFTHVAVYVGDGQVIHSKPDVALDGSLSGGVEEVPLEALLQDGITFVVLRSSRLTDALRSTFVDAARSHIGVPYDYGSIIRCIGMDLKIVGKLGLTAQMLKETITNIKPPSTQSARPTARDYARSFICSDFVYAVFDELFQQHNPCNYPGGHPGPIIMPCAFYANPNFSDVDIDVPTITTVAPSPLTPAANRLN